MVGYVYFSLKSVILRVFFKNAAVKVTQAEKIQFIVTPNDLMMDK
jgi:hypothetical protein